MSVQDYQSYPTPTGMSLAPQCVLAQAAMKPSPPTQLPCKRHRFTVPPFISLPSLNLQAQSFQPSTIPSLDFYTRNNSSWLQIQHTAPERYRHIRPISPTATQSSRWASRPLAPWLTPNQTLTRPKRTQHIRLRRSHRPQQWPPGTPTSSKRRRPRSRPSVRTSSQATQTATPKTTPTSAASSAATTPKKVVPSPPGFPRIPRLPSSRRRSPCSSTTRAQARGTEAWDPRRSPPAG